jgi:hypothetical protein
MRDINSKAPWGAAFPVETDMVIQIRLVGAGGELDKQTIDVSDDDSAEVSEHIHEAMACWVLSPGDTIIITETAS